MPFRSMSLEEFARHIAMDAREVRRLADRGKLPGQKVGGLWRFNRARVTEWLQQEMPKLDESRLIALEEAMSGPRPGSARDTRMSVTELIDVNGVAATLPAKTKGSVLRRLVELAERTGMLYDAPGLLEALQEREDLYSTALPNGVAIPHPRQPMPYVSAEPFVCVGRVIGGVAFGGAHRELTRLFFLICSHDDRGHLHVLARLTRLLDPA
ncbi:MAG: PTS sugar transporter subunit IIA, partial [Planctomycetes bacterium]|nr:PTS sugar transporter subunit IIA [Planctomycetota bacterium]